jgi:hypothetical protein
LATSVGKTVVFCAFKEQTKKQNPNKKVSLTFAKSIDKRDMKKGV